MANTKKNTQVNANAKIEKILADLKAQVEAERSRLQAAADACNEARSLGDSQALDIAKANGKEVEKACAKACKDAAFYELAFVNEDTIKAAIKAKSYMTYVLKDEKDSDTDSKETVVVNREVFISLKELDTYCTTHGVQGSVDKNWSNEFLALSGAIVAKIVLGFTDAEKREATIKALKEDYYFSKALVKHEMAIGNPDLADPTSKNQIMKKGQDMVEHLVGSGYVFKAEDYKFLEAVATTYDRRSQNADVMKSRDLYNVNNKVFQHIVYGVPYEINTKKK